MDILKKIVAARDAGQLKFFVETDLQLPGWFFDAIEWSGQPPTVLIASRNFLNLGGEALLQTNEIVIFPQPDFERAETVLAHEVAHFLTPVGLPKHGVYFLIQFGGLLTQFLPVREIEPLLFDCVDRNWNRFSPSFLKKRAVSNAMKILTYGGMLPRREPGLVYFFQVGSKGVCTEKAAC